MANASAAALSSNSWLLSKMASVPLIMISSATSDEIKKMMGIAEAMGDGILFLLTLFANALNLFMINESAKIVKIMMWKISLMRDCNLLR